MKILLAALCLTLCLGCFAVSTATAQEMFPRKSWRSFEVSRLDFSIYLPRKFKPQRSSDPDFVMYARSRTPVMAVGILRYDTPVGQLSRTEAERFVDDLHWELYLWSDIDYYSTYDPSYITNYAGQNGFQFMFTEFGPKLQDYYWLFEVFFDSDGYIYTVITLADLDCSPHIGTGITFYMQNGCMRSLVKPPAETGYPPGLLAGIGQELLRVRDSMLSGMN